MAGPPGSQGFAMGLAVPGLTVPWGHAGYLWVATAASIAIHEVNYCHVWHEHSFMRHFVVAFVNFLAVAFTRLLHS